MGEYDLCVNMNYGWIWIMVGGTLSVRGGGWILAYLEGEYPGRGQEKTGIHLWGLKNTSVWKVPGKPSLLYSSIA